MAQFNECRIWNDGHQEYVEVFNGKEVRIPAKGFVKMDYYQGVRFMGVIPPGPNDANGMPVIHKPLKMDPILSEGEGGAKIPVTPEFKCMGCSQVFQSAGKLEEHVAKNHTDAMIDEKEREKLVKKRSALSS